MPCKHLKELYDICQTHQLKLSSTDLIRIVCPQCGVEEVCPSVLEDEYETRHHEETRDCPDFRKDHGSAVVGENGTVPLPASEPNDPAAQAKFSAENK
jgi:hypothetical protein